MTAEQIDELNAENSKIEIKYDFLYADLGRKFEVYLDPTHWVVKEALKVIADNRARQADIRKEKNDYFLKKARVTD